MTAYQQLTHRIPETAALKTLCIGQETADALQEIDVDMMADAVSETPNAATLVATMLMYDSVYDL